jgi:hypothetical protein
MQLVGIAKLQLLHLLNAGFDKCIHSDGYFTINAFSWKLMCFFIIVAFIMFNSLYGGKPVLWIQIRVIKDLKKSQEN